MAFFQPLVMVMCHFFCILSLLVYTTTAAFSITALPTDYNGIDSHFYVVFNCNSETNANEYCNPTNSYSFHGPSPECSTSFNVHFLWTDITTTTIIAEKTIQPFPIFHFQSPFFNPLLFENKTIGLYFIITKDNACAVPTTQQSTEQTYTFQVDDVDVASTTQIIVTSPFIQAPLGNLHLYSSAALRIFPKPRNSSNVIMPTSSIHIHANINNAQGTLQNSSTHEILPFIAPINENSPRLEYTIYFDPIAEMAAFQTLELIPTGVFQFYTNTAQFLHCVFVYNDQTQDAFIVEFTQSQYGLYKSYTIQLADHFIPNISTPIPLLCFTPSESTNHYIPLVIDQLNGLIVRFTSSLLQPTTQIIHYGIHSTKTSINFQLIEVSEQFGPAHLMYDNYFSHGEAISPFFSRFIEKQADKNTTYTSIYQFQHTIIPSVDPKLINRSTTHMFPCLVDENYSFLVSAIEFGLISYDPSVPNPTFQQIQSQVISSQFTITCVNNTPEMEPKNAMAQNILWVGDFVPLYLDIASYLSIESLPQYPTLIFHAKNQQEVLGFRSDEDYRSCLSYQLNIFLQLSIPSTTLIEGKVPSDSQRNRGIFILRNGYKYAPSPLYQTSGGVFQESVLYSIQEAGEVSKQRFISNSTLNTPALIPSEEDTNSLVMLYVDSTYHSGDDTFSIHSFTIQPPQHSGSGVIQPSTKSDKYFQIILTSPQFMFYPRQLTQEINPAIDCTWGSKHDEKSAPIKVKVTIYPYFLTIDTAVVQDETNSLLVVKSLKCNDLRLKHIELPNKSHDSHTISLLVRQPSIVTGSYSNIALAQAIAERHVLRNIVISFACILLAGIAVYVAFRLWKRNQLAKAEFLEATAGSDSVNLGTMDTGYDNLEE